MPTAGSAKLVPARRSAPFRPYPMENVDAFLRWTAGDLLAPAIRAAYAEWLVYRALELDPGPHRREAPVQVCSGDVSLAVRSAAYVLSRGQEQPGPISFAIEPRMASAFVFCLLTEQDPRLADPLDLAQWLFWVVPTARLHPERQSIGLQPLIRAHGEGVGHGDLSERLAALRSTGSAVSGA